MTKRDMTDIIGMTFNKLTVISYLRRVNSRPIYLCQCECGNYKEVSRGALRQNKVKSCGCLHRVAAKASMELGKGIFSEEVKNRVRVRKGYGAIEERKKKECAIAMATPVDKTKFDDDWMFGDAGRSRFFED